MSNSKRPQNPQLRHEPASKATPLVVALVVLLCIGAIVVLAATMNGKDEPAPNAGSEPTTAVETTPPVDPTASAASSEAPPSNLDCTQAPAPPGQGEQFDAAPDPSLAEDTTWTATVTTNCGDITLELDGAKAPQTVASFIFLADKGYYDDNPCHRLTTSGIFVLQCGDPTGQGSGGPGYGYGIENAPADGVFPTGSLAMARTSDPNSNGSQFFIVYKNTTLPTDGGGYSIFGQVTGGLDLLQAIAKQGVDGGGGDGAPAQPISILGVSVTKG